MPERYSIQYIKCRQHIGPDMPETDNADNDKQRIEQLATFITHGYKVNLGLIELIS